MRKPTAGWIVYNDKKVKPMKKKVLNIEKQIGELIDLQVEAEKLPALSDVEKAKFEQSFAIDQLYYSSKLEGSSLTKKMIDKAIHGKELPVA